MCAEAQLIENCCKAGLFHLEHRATGGAFVTAADR
jgi:hypothetical protein